MIARWEAGREIVDRLLTEGHLERVAPDLELAELLVHQARDIREFGAMRRLRNQTEYPSFEQPTASRDDVRAAQNTAQRLLEGIPSLIHELPVY